MTCVLFVFGVAFVVQMVYSIFFFHRLAIFNASNAQNLFMGNYNAYKKNVFLEKKNDLPLASHSLIYMHHNEKCPTYLTIGISVIICAKNEAANLLQNLPIVLSQNYQIFEVIVVNDRSDDETAQILQGFQAQSKHLIVVDILPTDTSPLQGKKYALSRGIAAARYDFLVLTDADCLPNSHEWLHYMASHPTRLHHKTIDLTQQTTTIPTAETNTDLRIILGYSPYEYRPTWLNACIQYETLHTAIQYLSFALCGLPYMGVGRNLAYSRQLYEQHNGFLPNAGILSGDDDLFVNRVANRNNTYIMLHPDSFCLSKPPDTWQQWIQQKQRHLSTAKHYRLLHQILLGLWSLSHFLFHVIFLYLLLCTAYWQSVLLVYVVKVSIQLPIFYQIIKKLRAPIALWKVLLLDLVWFFYYLFFSLPLLQHKNIRWK